MATIFVSYSRTDAKDPQLNRFVADLRRLMALKLGDAEADTVFVDNHDLPLAVHWRRMISEQLSTCQCFVALLSPEMLRSKYCGKEWGTFAKRLAKLPDQPPVQIPLLWQPCPSLPGVVQNIQLYNESLGPEYPTKGLRYLMHKDPQAYAAFIESFTTRLTELVLLHGVPRERPAMDFFRVRNAFARPLPKWPLVAGVAASACVALFTALDGVSSGGGPTVQQQVEQWAAKACAPEPARGSAPLRLPAQLAALLSPAAAVSLGESKLPACPEVAIVLADHAHERDGSKLDGMILKAQALHHARRYEDAIQVTESLIARWPERPEPFYLRGRSFLATGDRPGYERDLRTACLGGHTLSCELINPEPSGGGTGP